MSQLTLEQYKQRDYLNDTIKVDIIADSVWPVIDHNKRLTTFMLTIPIAVLGHLVRHRVFSLSVASNRALNSGKIINTLNFVPDWRTAKKGMQPAEFIENEQSREDLDWLLYHLREYTIDSVEQMAGEYNVSKEIVNRYLSPFQMINVLVTSSDYSNFFTLRDHEDAQFETQITARRMKETLETHTPNYLAKYEWHLPFITAQDFSITNRLSDCLAISAARCARTSYLLPDTNTYSTIDADVKLFKKLLSPPIHASPFEHIATPLRMQDIYNEKFSYDLLSPFYGNTTGWVQLRKLLEIDENEWPNNLSVFSSLTQELRNLL